MPVPNSAAADDVISARNQMLAMIPVPPEYPDDPLKPITIPAPFNLHEFLGNASGVRLPLAQNPFYSQSDLYNSPYALRKYFSRAIS